MAWCGLELHALPLSISANTVLEGAWTMTGWEILTDRWHADKAIISCM